MNKVILFTIIGCLSFLSCDQTDSTDSIIKKHETNYNELRNKITKGWPQLMNDPEGKQMVPFLLEVKRHDLRQYLKSKKYSNYEFEESYNMINNFVSNFGDIKEFILTEAHIKSYNKVRKRILENRTTVEAFIKQTASIKTDGEISVGQNFAMIMKYDAKKYAQNTNATQDHFEKNMETLDKQWDGVLSMMNNMRK